ENRERKIPGRDYADDASGQILEAVFLPRDIDPLLRLHIDRRRRIKLAEVDCFIDVGRRFAPLLAALVNLPRGQLESPLAHDVRCLAKKLGSPLDTQIL